jgi:hypothetical protein
MNHVLVIPFKGHLLLQVRIVLNTTFDLEYWKSDYNKQQKCGAF